jgi:hypothetical protein
MKVPGFALGLLLTMGGLPDEAFAQLTESTATARPGGWLMEVDVLSVAVDRRTPANDGTEYRSTTIGSILLSTGLSERVDLQLGLDIWRDEKIRSGGASTTSSDHGDGWLRAKWNFHGGETEGPAWAILPYIKLPFAGDDFGNESLEPGALLIFGCPIGGRVQCNANFGTDWLDDGAGRRNAPLYGSCSFTSYVTDTWAFYGELSGWVDPTDPVNWTGEIGFGITCNLNASTWLDVAFYAGLNRTAPDYTPVLRVGCQF